MEDNNRFLLYIDILGFTDMTNNEPRKVARVYSILDELNVHKHNSFKTIVFSDTILVYNPDLAKTDRERISNMVSDRIRRRSSSSANWTRYIFQSNTNHRLIQSLLT